VSDKIESASNGSVEGSRPHLDMKPEDMFPETPIEPFTAPLGGGTGMKPPKDHVPSWLYRLTEELSPDDVRRLFIPMPHEAFRKFIAWCQEQRGEAGVRLLKIAAAWVQPPRPRWGLRGWISTQACRHLHLVTREQADYELAMQKSEHEAVTAKARLFARQVFVDDVAAKAEQILGDLFPRPNAEVREGKDYADRRVLAVWTGRESPGEEDKPEF